MDLNEKNPIKNYRFAFSTSNEIDTLKISGIVINAEKVRFTGKKLDDKTYLTYSGYPGGQKSATPRELLARIPTRVVETAVRKMLPKNKLGDAMYKKLFVYAGSEHFHQAQKPEVINL